MKNNKKIAFLIDNIEDFGKLVSYCIENDINVFRCYFIPGHYYHIDFDHKMLFHGSKSHFGDDGFVLKKPCFIYTRYREYILDFNS